MEIKYTKKRLTSYLALGVLMFLMGIFTIYEDSFSIYSYLWFTLGALYLLTTYYERKNQYITIDNDKLIKHSIFKKTIDVNDIKKIRKYVSIYKIETSDKNLKINKDIIEAESLYKLEDYFKKLNIKS
ncbi:hypothetical protein ML462_15360 [Gramella lutea]|uniref:Uncharacterized protein n=1 Tax=Christiangramia lutea TaxID=1607951 RepID=A0A9X1V5B8_9FLAO|nr:hypothetical protein [Christiangramia lutea]MCH4824550.1 hypothetical protein [Christiangramia lutea]